MKASYRRCNAGLILHLRRNNHPSTDTTTSANANSNTSTTGTTDNIEPPPPNDIIIGNAHLYWNPHYEYVKLSQAHYLLHRIHAFAAHPSRQQQQQQQQQQCRSGGGGATTTERVGSS